MMTVHAAKGLEFDIVFLTGMEERLFPLRGQRPGEEEELEEERRLAYVAVTRARKQLYIIHTNTRTIYGQMRYNQPARFLDQIPPKHQQRVATRALHDLSRQFTRTRHVSHRDQIRAGIDRDRARSVAMGSGRSGGGLRHPTCRLRIRGGLLPRRLQPRRAGGPLSFLSAGLGPKHPGSNQAGLSRASPRGASQRDATYYGPQLPPQRPFVQRGSK